MTTVNLSARGVFGNGWVKPVIALVLAALIGLAVKLIWFDQAAYLVPVNQVPVGANLAHEQWREVHASLGQLSSQYLTSTKPPTGYATSTLDAGELVSKTAVGRFAPQTIARIVVTNKTQLGSGVKPGAIVSIWSSEKLAQGLVDSPKRIVESATVGRVIAPTGVFGAQNQQVEVLVDQAQTPQLLQAVASDSPIFLVAQE
ncbi:MAG: hypothetical protein ACKOWK_01600 [Micrococcales bacterium]